LIVSINRVSCKSCDKGNNVFEKSHVGDPLHSWEGHENEIISLTLKAVQFT
jgi:hypothetical protein